MHSSFLILAASCAFTNALAVNEARTEQPPSSFHVTVTNPFSVDTQDLNSRPLEFLNPQQNWVNVPPESASVYPDFSKGTTSGGFRVAGLANTQAMFSYNADIQSKAVSFDLSGSSPLSPLTNGYFVTTFTSTPPVDGQQTSIATDNYSIFASFGCADMAYNFAAGVTTGNITITHADGTTRTQSGSGKVQGLVESGDQKAVVVSPVGDVATITFDWNATPLTVSYGSDPKNAVNFGIGGQVTLNYCGSDN